MSTRKPKEKDTRIGLWMDHHVAHLVYRNDDGDYEIFTIESGATTSKPTLEKDRKNETRKNHREQEELKAYFKEIQKKLVPYNHILITGPSTARTEFHHQLMKARSFAGRRIAEEKANTMTDRQLLSFMKKKLGKPMDIFRPEEVV